MNFKLSQLFHVINTDMYEVFLWPLEFLNPITGFLLVVLLAGLVVKKRASFRALPGPTGVPLLGSSALLGRFEKHWDGFSALRQKFGDIYGITVGTTKCAVVSSLEIINTILLKNSNDFLNRPDFLRFHAIFRGNRGISIALCNWSWKQITRRNITNPFMHPDKRSQHFFIDQMSLAIENEMDYMVKDLKNLNGKPFFPRYLLLSTSANIFYKYMCGKRYDHKDSNFREVVQNYDEILRELFMGYALDFMPWLKPFNMKKLNHLSNLSKSVAALTEPLFKEHVKTLDPSSPRDLIDLLLINVSENDTKDTLTMEEAEVIVDDLIGGHSALGNLMLWAFYFLAQEMQVQKTIREEVSFATRGNMKMPEMSDREQLKYVEATILEVLRVVSSPMIPHAAVRDTLLEGYFIPKDTLILFNTYDINMDPTLWEEPKTFNPSRFLNDNAVTIPKHFFPFGKGRRSCLGDRLVRSTMLVTVATIVQNFEVDLPNTQPKPDYDDIPGIVIPREDISLIFKPTAIRPTV